MLLPVIPQPRYAVLSSLKALVTILDAAKLHNTQNLQQDLDKARDHIKNAVTAWLPTVPKDKNPAKKLAFELAGKSAVVYGGPLMSPIAYKWKISFNENAKNIAWWNEFPEFNHNEFIGWSSHPVDKPYGIVELRSNLEHERVQKRFTVAERLLSGRRPAPYVVVPEGQALLEQMLWAMVYGDFVTTYLALLNNQDPAPVDLVEKFKLELNK